MRDDCAIVGALGGTRCHRGEASFMLQPERAAVPCRGVVDGQMHHHVLGKFAQVDRLQQETGGTKLDERNRFLTKPELPAMA